MTAPSVTLDSLPLGYSALIIGATGTLGQAFVQHLLQDPHGGPVLGWHRRPTVPPSSHRVEAWSEFSLESEASIVAAAQQARQACPEGIQLVIDATGALQIDGRGPEKRLEALDAEGLMRAFQVNAIGRALVLKHVIPLLVRPGRSLVGVLSARVGSLEDNRLGGWYGYRASKAAGNMLLQCAAIESARTRPEAVFAALQPGTVASPLSAPHTRAGGHEVLAAEESAGQLLGVLNRLQPTGRAQFCDHRGEAIPW